MRLALLLAVLATASGCTSTTRIVSRTDAAALASVNAALAGRQADVNLRSGELAAGRVRFVRLDSTAWTENGLPRAVQTGDVRSLVTDNRRTSIRRGALIGVGVAVGLAVLTIATLDRSPDTFSEEVGNAALSQIALLAIPMGAVEGAALGALAGHRTEYVLVDAAAETSAEPPGRPR